MSSYPLEGHSETLENIFWWGKLFAKEEKHHYVWKDV